MKILAANVLAISFLAACVWFVRTNHIGFGVASMILAALSSHGYKSEDEA